jgi:predicted RNA binding protein YcfA (HicA-like mRNA interferase family)
MAEKRLLKLVGKILRNPREVKFEELRHLLEGFGFVCRQPGSGSSHYTFRKPGSYTITVPKKKPVNQAYVKTII